MRDARNRAPVWSRVLAVLARLLDLAIGHGERCARRRERRLEIADDIHLLPIAHLRIALGRCAGGRRDVDREPIAELAAVREAHIAAHIAALGACVSVTDVNNDNWPDLYFTSSRFGATNALYLNQGDGTFRDVAESAGVAHPGFVKGVAWGDVDAIKVFRQRSDLTDDIKQKILSANARALYGL